LTNHADYFKADLEAVYAMAELAAQTIEEVCQSIKGMLSFQSMALNFATFLSSCGLGQTMAPWWPKYP
jgi:hypothetical protein